MTRTLEAEKVKAVVVLSPTAVNLLFKELPPENKNGLGRGRKRWFSEEIQNELKSRPGEWAVVKTCSNYATANNMAHKERKRTEEFEFATRGNEVFARALTSVEVPT